MSDKDASYWRAKYRALLREQEQARGASTSDYQRAIEKLAQTAGLLEQQLAGQLNAVARQAARKQWGRPGQLALLEQSLAEFEKRLKTQRALETESLQQVGRKLMALPLSDAARKAARQLKTLHKAQNFATDWLPFLLALERIEPHANAPRPKGFLANLFGAQPAEQQAEAEPQPADEPVPELETEPEPMEHLDAVGATARQRTQADLRDLLGLSGQLLERDENSLREPPFSKISDRISTVLGDLLAQIEPQDVVAEKALAARLRIDKGLNWYELVPTLEDIRDLVMALLLNARQDYQQYLLHLLEQVNQLIHMTGEAATELVREETVFLADLEQEIGAFGQALRSVANVEDLKRSLEARLQTLAGLVSRRRQGQQGDDAGLAQVKALQARIAALETEAKGRQQELEQQRLQARTDALTGLPNRDAYNERVHHEIERLRRYGRPLTLAILDIDHFKSVNDNYSHQAGDRVLKVISNAVANQLRDVDFMARYGGEEFVVLLPETVGADALTKMDRIREAVAKTQFRFKDQALQLSYSTGLAQAIAGETASELFARADRMLYRAKARGRNRCELASSEGSD